MATSLRLVEGADQILAERMVHAHLAADRAVHLRQQRRRHVRHADPTQVGGRREPGGVADDAAADRDDAGAAVRLAVDERVVDAAGGLQRLGLLAVGDEDALEPRQRARDRRAVQPPHGGAADDERRGRGNRSSASSRPRLSEQTRFDDDRGSWRSRCGRRCECDPRGVPVAGGRAGCAGGRW